MYHRRLFGTYREDFCTWTHAEQFKIRLRPIVLIFYNWHYTLKPIPLTVNKLPFLSHKDAALRHSFFKLNACGYVLTATAAQCFLFFFFQTEGHDWRPRIIYFTDVHRYKHRGSLIGKLNLETINVDQRTWGNGRISKEKKWPEILRYFSDVHQQTYFIFI